MMATDESQSDAQYVVVARRYRPQNFEELVGQGPTAQALASAITTNRVGHAYLFTGARGVGKTSTARIFAKALNCENGPTTTPCNKCDICQAISTGDDVDVIEIDGASNRGIDEIRQLRSNVNVRPSRARFKVYIIDEVHMLTNQAFNALLKTLEEPPEHVKFIFCTTEADKIPITVLSRCQRFDFAPIETKSIIQRLAEICKSEGVEAEPDALQIIARRAAGSMRDSQSLLEQLLSFGGQRVTTADVHSLLGTAKSSRLSSLAAALLARDAASAFSELEAAVAEGVDVGQLVEQLLGYMRDSMAALVGAPPELLLHNSAAEYDVLKVFGQQLGLETLLAVAQILDQTLARMRLSTHSRTLAELALVRICKLENLEQLPALMAQLQGGGALAQPAAPPPRTAKSVAPSTPPREVPAPAPPAAQPAAQKKTEDVSNGSSAPTVPPSEEPVLEPAAALDFWKQTLAELRDMTGDCASKFERLAISGPNRLVIHFRKAYTTAKEFCERPEKRSRLEQTLSRIANRNLRIDFAVLPDEPASGERASQEASPAVSRRERQLQLQRHPLVRQVIEAFDAEILNVIEAEPAAAEATDSPAGPDVAT